MRELLNTKEVAKYLGINEKKVYYLAKAGKIPCTKVTGKWTFPKKLVDQWIEENSKATPGGKRAERRDFLLAAGSDDPSLGILRDLYARRMAPTSLFWATVGSSAGLEALRDGVADLALAINLLILLACMSYFGFTLTLPGIAGIVLTVAMAVDYNVLVFERIREELDLGKPVRIAVEAGFDRAWLSIRDSNVSTIITCLILWWFGSSFGASLVTGFAVTLLIGVLISMFSAIYVTRTFLRVFVGRRSPQQRWLFGLERAGAGTP